MKRALAFLMVVGCSTAAPPPPEPRLKKEAELAKHPDWPESVKAKLRAGKVEPGMTATQVMAAWGDSFRRASGAQGEAATEMTFFFEGKDVVESLVPSDRVCPQGRWFVRFEKRKSDDGKSEWIATTVGF